MPMSVLCFIKRAFQMLSRARGTRSESLLAPTMVCSHCSTGNNTSSPFSMTWAYLVCQSEGCLNAVEQREWSSHLCCQWQITVKNLCCIKLWKTLSKIYMDPKYKRYRQRRGRKRREGSRDGWGAMGGGRERERGGDCSSWCFLENCLLKSLYHEDRLQLALWMRGGATRPFTWKLTYYIYMSIWSRFSKFLEANGHEKQKNSWLQSPALIESACSPF